VTATAIGAYATTSLLKAMIGTTDSDDDATVGLVCDRVNAYIESTTGRVIAPISSATYLLDGSGLTHLYFPKGIRAVTALSIGDTTGDTLDAVNASDILLRPLVQDRDNGWPAMYLYLSDVPVSTVARKRFPKGRANVSMTCTAGWAAIPDEITDVALAIAQRAWNNLKSGLQDAQGLDEQGRPVVARYVSGRDREVLRRYTLREPQVFG